VIAEQLTLDDLLTDQPAVCDPGWTSLRPGDRTPTPADLRRAELGDLHDQGAGAYALRNAHTVPTGRYL
jgi:hypothetical protein